MSVETAVARIRAETDLEPRIGVVLGSGLGGLADALDGRVEIPYGEIPGWPASTAVGHAGVLVLGELDGVPVVLMRGRAHLYEGVGADRAVFGVRVLGRLGVGTLVVTNAAGGINEAYRPGPARPHLRPCESPGNVAARRAERRRARPALSRT